MAIRPNVLFSRDWHTNTGYYVSYTGYADGVVTYEYRAKTAGAAPTEGTLDYSSAVDQPGIHQVDTDLAAVLAAL